MDPNSGLKGHPSGPTSSVSSRSNPETGGFTSTGRLDVHMNLGWSSFLTTDRHSFRAVSEYAKLRKMKDLVDHLRTVHFTVLVVALIFTAALQFERRRPLERAADDAEAILHLAQRWRDTLDHLKADVDLIMQSYPIMIQTSGVQLVFPERRIYRTLAPKPRRGVHSLDFRVTKKWIYVDDHVEDDEELLDRMPKQWTNLQQFLDFWDAFHEGRAAFLPLILGFRKGAADCNAIDRTSQDTVNSFLAPKSRRVGSHWSITAIVERDGDQPICTFPEVRVPSILLDLPHALKGVAPQASKWGAGLSSIEFRELIEQAKLLENTPLDGLADTLRIKANTDTDRIELFQAKLPASTITIYGSIVLIICQFYLLAHLLELRTMAHAVVPHEWPTGYVGLYANRLVFAFTITSLAVWPLVPIAISIYQTLTERPFPLIKTVATSVGLLLSAVVGIFSAATLRSVRYSKMMEAQKLAGIVSPQSSAAQPECAVDHPVSSPLAPPTGADHSNAAGRR